MTGPRYAFNAVAVTRSYSPHFGAMSTEQVTNTSGAIRSTICLSFNSCFELKLKQMVERIAPDVFVTCSVDIAPKWGNSCFELRNDHRKQIAIACTPSATSSRIAAS